MLRYLKEALLVRPRIPLLGGVPVNLIAAAGFGILGVAHPGFWLLGAGLIGGFSLMLATSPRFQKVVDGRELAARDWETRALEATLVSQLPPASRERLARLDGRCARIVETSERAAGEQAGADMVLESSRDALRKLRWLYIKLLTAEKNLEAMDEQAGEAEIRDEMVGIERELAADRLSPTARASRQATLEILRRRLENAQRRRASLEEIEGDLGRIDAHIDLALEEATLKSQPVALSANIDLATQLLDGGAAVFGDSQAMVLDLEQRIGTKG